MTEKFKTLEEARMEYFTLVFRYFKGNRRKTAEALAIDVKTVKAYIDNCEFDNIDTTTFEVDLKYICPTNDERLKHLDRNDGRTKK